MRAFTLIVVLIGAFVHHSVSIEFSIANLDAVNKEKLREFHSLVVNELPHDYMKDDLYLLPFLAAKDYNVEESSKYLREHLAWREKDKIDSILDEDWSDMEKLYPFSVDGTTKEGRPILYINFGAYDISRASQEENKARFSRYITKLMEQAEQKARKNKGKNPELAQVDVLINSEGYNMDSHGCWQCLQTYKDIWSNIEFQYPGLNKAYFVNTPGIFESLFPIISKVFSRESSRKSLEVMGGKELYKPVLLKHIDKEQLQRVLKEEL